MNLHLTHGYANEAQIRATPHGMPAWAGTGPEGSVCRQCVNWCRKGEGSYRRRPDGTLEPRRCRQYSRMVGGGESHKGLPPETPACRHFVDHPSPPPLHPKRRRK